MKNKIQVNLKYLYNSKQFLFLSIIILTIFALSITTSIIVYASQSNNHMQDSVSDSVLSNTNSKPDPTVEWKTVLDTRSNISFNIKYPIEWDETSDYCLKPPNLTDLNLSSSCLRLIVITDQLPPDDESSIGRDIVLTSKIQTIIQGYKAIRKIYSLPEDPENTPDTYQLWIYDNNKPFILIIGWIGEGTNIKTSSRFVKILDQMVNTLKLHKK